MAFEKTPVRFKQDDPHPARKVNRLVGDTLNYVRGVEREHSSTAEHRDVRFEHALIVATWDGSGWQFDNSRPDDVHTQDNGPGAAARISILNVSLFHPDSPWGLLGVDDTGRAVTWVRSGVFALLFVAADAEQLTIVMMGPRDAA